MEQIWINGPAGWMLPKQRRSNDVSQCQAILQGSHVVKRSMASEPGWLALFSQSAPPVANQRVGGYCAIRIRLSSMSFVPRMSMHLKRSFLSLDFRPALPRRSGIVKSSWTLAPFTSNGKHKLHISCGCFSTEQTHFSWDVVSGRRRWAEWQSCWSCRCRGLQEIEILEMVIGLRHSMMCFSYTRIHSLCGEKTRIFAKQNESSKNQATWQESRKHARNAGKLQGKNAFTPRIIKRQGKTSKKGSPKDETKTWKNKNKNIQMKFGPLV